MALAAESHPFPFRTRKLSLPAPMVLGGHPPGRVGRRRILIEKAPTSVGAFCFSVTVASWPLRSVDHPILVGASGPPGRAVRGARRRGTPPQEERRLGTAAPEARRRGTAGKEERRLDRAAREARRRARVARRAWPAAPAAPRRGVRAGAGRRRRATVAVRGRGRHAPAVGVARPKRRVGAHVPPTRPCRRRGARWLGLVPAR